MITGLNHVTLSVSDIERSFIFYRDVLGFRPRAKWQQGAYFTAGELWFCLSLDTTQSFTARAGYSHTAFSVDQQSFEALRCKIIESGVITWKDNRSEGNSLYFLDLDGHKLELHVGDVNSRLADCRAHPYAGMIFFDA